MEKESVGTVKAQAAERGIRIHKPISVGLGKLGLPLLHPRPPLSRVSGGSALDRHGSTVSRRYPGGRAWVNQEEGAKSIAAAAGPVIFAIGGQS